MRLLLFIATITILTEVLEWRETTHLFIAFCKKHSSWGLFVLNCVVVLGYINDYSLTELSQQQPAADIEC